MRGRETGVGIGFDDDGGGRDGSSVFFSLSQRVVLVCIGAAGESD